MAKAKAFFPACVTLFLVSLFLVGLVVLSLLSPSTAMGASPTSTVGSATVKEGATSVEVRVGSASDASRKRGGQRIRFLQLVDHGVSDRIALRLVLQQTEQSPDSIEFANAAVEARLQLFEKSTSGVDAGVRLGYTHSDGNKTPHRVNSRLLVQGTLGDGWRWRHNTQFEHEVGSDSRAGVAVGLRSRLTYALPFSEFRSEAGIEAFSTLGKVRDLSRYSDTDQQLGPLFLVNLPQGVFAQTGYRAGVSRAASDHSWKFVVGMNF